MYWKYTYFFLFCHRLSCRHCLQLTFKFVLQWKTLALPFVIDCTRNVFVLCLLARSGILLYNLFTFVWRCLQEKIILCNANAKSEYTKKRFWHERNDISEERMVRMFFFTASFLSRKGIYIAEMGARSVYSTFKILLTFTVVFNSFCVWNLLHNMQENRLQNAECHSHCLKGFATRTKNSRCLLSLSLQFLSFL